MGKSLQLPNLPEEVHQGARLLPYGAHRDELVHLLRQMLRPVQPLHQGRSHLLEQITPADHQVYRRPRPHDPLRWCLHHLRRPAQALACPEQAQDD